MKFAKLFDLPDGQILVEKTIEDNDGQQEYGIATKTVLEGVVLRLSGNYSSEDSRDQVFEKLDEDYAAAVMNHFQTLV